MGWFRKLNLGWSYVGIAFNKVKLLGWHDQGHKSYIINYVNYFFLRIIIIFHSY